MHHYWLFRFNSEILIWKVSFSKSETHVWNFSGYTTDIDPVLYIFWILNALSQNKIPRGPTWPVVSRSAPLTSAPVTPSTLLLAQQAPGPWLSFLFLRGVKLISISPWSLLADWNQSSATWNQLLLSNHSRHWLYHLTAESRYQLYHLLTRCPWRSTCPPIPLISSFVKRVMTPK